MGDCGILFVTGTWFTYQGSDLAIQRSEAFFDFCVDGAEKSGKLGVCGLYLMINNWWNPRGTKTPACRA